MESPIGISKHFNKRTLGKKSNLISSFLKGVGAYGFRKSSTSSLDRVQSLPSDTEAEQGILCSAILDPARTFSACARVGLTEHHFYFTPHATMYQLLSEFWAANEPVDIITLTSVLRDRKTLDACAGRIRGESLSGAGYVTALGTFIGTAGYIENYVETVWRKAMRRQAITEVQKVSELAYDPQTEDAEIFDCAERSLLKLVKMQEGTAIHSRGIDELMIRAMNRYDARQSGDWKIEFPTGLTELDDLTLGFKAPEVTALCALPSDGKSTLAVNIMEHLVLKCGKKVGFISLDDSDDQVADRLLQSVARVNIHHMMKTGTLSTWDHEKLAAAAIKLAGAKDRLFIRDDGGLSPAEISATFAAWKASRGLDFGIIDHIQLARMDDRRSKTEEAEGISRTLKPMAKRFGIPLLVLSQVTEGDSGSYRTKNSRALEEDANNVWTIRHDKEQMGLAYIHIAKQKDGPRNESAKVTFLREYTRFENRAKDEPEEALIDVPKTPKNKHRHS